MENNIDTKPIYIPSGIKVENEPMRGFSSRALKKFIVGCGGTGIICILFGLIINEVSYGMFFWMVACMMCYTIFRENTMNMSVVDYCVEMYRFATTQQEYEFILKNGIDEIERMEEE